MSQSQAKLDNTELIKKRVAEYYWKKDINCAVTTLKVLSEKFDIILNNQVLNAAIGMHGAGGHGAQCGLVEGALMFIGIVEKANNTIDKEIIENCKKFADQFEKKFNSLECKILRPQGFKKENTPHICEHFTCEAIEFAMDFISSLQINKSITNKVRLWEKSEPQSEPFVGYNESLHFGIHHS